MRNIQPFIIFFCSINDIDLKSSILTSSKRFPLILDFNTILVTVLERCSLASFPLLYLSSNLSMLFVLRDVISPFSFICRIVPFYVWILVFKVYPLWMTSNSSCLYFWTNQVSHPMWGVLVHQPLSYGYMSYTYRSSET